MSMAIHVGENTYSIESAVEGSLYPNVMSMRSGTEIKKPGNESATGVKKIQVEFTKLPPADYIYFNTARIRIKPLFMYLVFLYFSSVGGII